MTCGAVWWICLKRWQRVSKMWLQMWMTCFRCVSNWLIYSHFCNQTKHTHSPLPLKQLNQSALTTSRTPEPLNPTPPNTHPAHVHSQTKHARTPMSAAKGSTDSLPHPARCLCRPLLEESCEPTQTNPTQLSFLTLFLFSSRSHQPGVEGKIHPSWGSVSGSGCLPFPGSTLQTGLPQRLTHTLLLLSLTQWRLPALCSLRPRYTDSLRIIQGESWWTILRLILTFS